MIEMQNADIFNSKNYIIEKNEICVLDYEIVGCMFIFF